MISKWYQSWKVKDHHFRNWSKIEIKIVILISIFYPKDGDLAITVIHAFRHCALARRLHIRIVDVWLRSDPCFFVAVHSLALFIFLTFITSSLHPLILFIHSPCPKLSPLRFVRNKYGYIMYSQFKLLPVYHSLLL